ncbi:hypothetical protein LSAT2_008235 [Lamellibrachia satsuma]|nr:hypothetical protein LSAT2_008235 [Lamellibrachia satsuma]
MASVESTLSCSSDTMGLGKDPGYPDTRSGRMQSVYESTLGSLYKLSRQRRHKLGWNQATSALLQTHTQLDYELQGVVRSRTATDKV